MRDAFEVRLLSADGWLAALDADISPDVILLARVKQDLGSTVGAPAAIEIRRPSGDAPAPETTVLQVTKMDIPAGPSPIDPSWDVVMFHLCETPNVEILEEWFERTDAVRRQVSMGRAAWFEVDESTDETRDWGEIHVTIAPNENEVHKLLSTPDWASNEALLAEAVGQRVILLLQPVVNRLALLCPAGAIAATGP